jgi:hypothetical protein
MESIFNTTPKDLGQAGTRLHKGKQSRRFVSEQRRGTNISQSSGNRLINLLSSFGPVFGSDGLGIQDGLCANQAVETFGGKAECVQGLQASFIIHLIECNGFGFEVATKLYTKKLDLTCEVGLLNRLRPIFSACLN